MATFKKFDGDIQVKKVVAKIAKVNDAAATATWNTGDLFSYVPSTQLAAKITKVSDVEAAFAAGKEVYLVAQGDYITKQVATEYKTTKSTHTVAMSSEATTTIVAYKVVDMTNINGYAAE